MAQRDVGYLDAASGSPPLDWSWAVTAATDGVKAESAMSDDTCHVTGVEEELAALLCAYRLLPE